MIAAQIKNTGAATIRIDDLAPGQVYQVGTQAWSSSRGSNLVAATSSPFTAPNDSSAPATPTGLVAIVGTGKVVSLDWNDNSEPDLQEYGVWRNTVDTPGSATKIAEVRASRFVDTDVVIGTPYFYWISAYDRTENQSAKGGAVGGTGSVTATPAVIPGSAADSSTPPNDPAAPTLNTRSVYTSSDGTVLSRMLINVPSMPTGAVILNILYRRNGQAGWIVGDQRSTGGGTSSIDDLTPGESYEIAAQAFNVFGVGSSIITATGSPFSAISKTAGPGACSSVSYISGSSTSYSGPAAYTFDGSDKVLQFSTRIAFVPPSDKDIDYFEWFSGPDPGGK